MHDGDTTGELVVPSPGALPVLVWRLPEPRLAVSSAVLGGGIGLRAWVVNAQVESDYDRPDPEAHLGEIAAAIGLSGPGVGLLTAAAVEAVVTATDGGVRVEATVGLDHATWAAAPPEPAGTTGGVAGTVNVVAAVPVRLSEAALVNAVATVAEAKAQALAERGVPGTGTASDATCVLCPAGGRAEPYGGPRSEWGARLARAVHTAVLAGARR